MSCDIAAQPASPHSLKLAKLYLRPIYRTHSSATSPRGTPLDINRPRNTPIVACTVAHCHTRVSSVVL